MRILFTSFPGVGHFHPMAPLALAAVRAGHDVIVAIGPDLVDWVTACGLSGVPAGLTQQDAIRRAAALAQPGEPVVAVMFTRIAPPAFFADLLRLTRDWRPDLVVHEESEFAGPAVAAHLGVPCATHSWNAPAKTQATRQRAAEAVSPLWSDLAGQLARVTGGIYLDACPPALQGRDIATVPHVLAVRPVSFDGPAAPAIDAANSWARPVAYVTFGTVPEFARAQHLRLVVAAVEAAVTGVVVVSSGPNAAGDLGLFGDRVYVRPYLPQSQILAVADVVVSHGGAGTTLGALEAGLGHVVLPQGGASQQRNGDRIDELGLDVALTPADQTPQRITDAVRRVLSDDEYGRAARAVRDQYAASPSPDEVVALLERIVAERE